MTSRLHSILSKSDNNILLWIREPLSAPKGVIQINTGTCIPQKVYWSYAEFLAQNGYITITYDYSDAEKYTSDVSHTAWIKDMESVFDYVLQTYPSLQKYVVGHSSGGQLIGYMNNCDQIDKIFLVASANGYIKNLNKTMQFLMRMFWCVIVPFSVRAYGYMNNKLFGKNGGFPKNIILELRSWCFEKDFFLPFFNSKNIQQHYHKILKPVVAYHLADDVIANKKSCEYIYDLYANAPRKFETLRAEDHGLKKFGHRGFFHPAAEKTLWYKFLNELEIQKA
ncbi:MAG: hypothetical protein JWN78_1970 [Bacteroidota bacterium]|nr:hypothetical protein [Bacteroidota bacterium]